MFFPYRNADASKDAGGLAEAQPDTQTTEDSYLVEKSGGKFKSWQEVEGKFNEYEERVKEIDTLKPEIESWNKFPELKKLKTLVETGANMDTFIKASQIDVDSKDNIYLLKEGLTVSGELKEVVDAKIKGYQKYLSESKLTSYKEKLESGEITQDQYDDFIEQREIKQAELNAEVAKAKQHLIDFKSKHSLDSIEREHQEYKQKELERLEISKREWESQVKALTKEFNKIASDINLGNKNFEFTLDDKQKQDLELNLIAAHSLGVPKDSLKEYAIGTFMASRWKDVVKAAIDQTKSSEAERFDELMNGKLNKQGSKSQSVSIKTDEPSDSKATSKLDKRYYM